MTPHPPPTPTETKTMVDGIYFDEIFLPMRERGRKIWICSKDKKIAIEKSILRGNKIMDEMFSGSFMFPPTIM